MTNIIDVAKRAGISTATISHVLNKTRFVNKDIKKKVLKAIDELNYYPNFAARSLRSRRSNIIGLLLPDISNSFYTTVTKGVEMFFVKML